MQEYLEYEDRMRRPSVRAERQGGSGEAFYFGGEPETNVVGAKHEAIL